jgi:hypothetical protein
MYHEPDCQCGGCFSARVKRPSARQSLNHFIAMRTRDRNTVVQKVRIPGPIIARHLVRSTIKYHLKIRGLSPK